MWEKVLQPQIPGTSPHFEKTSAHSLTIFYVILPIFNYSSNWTMLILIFCGFIAISELLCINLLIMLISVHVWRICGGLWTDKGRLLQEKGRLKKSLWCFNQIIFLLSILSHGVSLSLNPMQRFYWTGKKSK